MMKINKLINEIRWADTIVIGGGSGLSSAASYNHYHWSSYFEQQLKEFKDYYGFKSPFEGFYYLFPDYESTWAYYASYIHAMYEAPTGNVYKDLKDICKDKEVFVLTSNIDMQFSRVFDEEQICYFQGDFRYLQCSQPCHDEIYDNKKIIYKMVNAIDDSLKVPSNLIPRCQHCGRIMVPWVRDDTFLEGKKWNKNYNRYKTFLETHINKKILLLDLGVGEMTPSVIKLPFWDITYQHKNIHYITINYSVESVPEHIKDQSINIKEDIAKILKVVKETN